MSACDECFKNFGIERGKSVYCNSCPYYKEEVEVEKNTDEINAQLDGVQNKGGEMGELNELAKKQSKFLQLDVGESIEAKFVDYKIIPSQYDPEKETVQYRLSIDGKDKFWTNGSGTVMQAFDEIPKGNIVRISRNEMLDKAGNVVEGKSVYKIEKIEK